MYVMVLLTNVSVCQSKHLHGYPAAIIIHSSFLNHSDALLFKTST